MVFPVDNANAPPNGLHNIQEDRIVDVLGLVPDFLLQFHNVSTSTYVNAHRSQPEPLGTEP